MTRAIGRAAMGEIRHSADLPNGYRATFIWSSRSGLSVEWSPAVPNVRRPHERRQFLAVYSAARAAFLSEVATTLGGAVAVVDAGGVSVFIPATRH